MQQEEGYWQQRAKAFQNVNSKFFHAQDSVRKKMIRIDYLKNDNEEIIDNHDEICKMAVEYFKGIFTGEGNVIPQHINLGSRVISDVQNAGLTKELEFDEFSRRSSKCTQTNRPGDGFSLVFFQHFWALLGKEIFESWKSWLRDCSFPPELNNTTLVLIPKKNNVERMTDVRPIALCNVLYKILAKVLVNRLRIILPVSIKFKIIHYVKRKNTGQEGEVALKLDINKAYDLVKCQYLKHIMEKMGFDQQWINWMLLSVTTVEYNVCVNGSLVGPVSLSRGLRQGDPLSPYLFLLSVEGLSNTIKEAALSNKINGCKICLNAPAITYFIFADDSFLFCKANKKKCKK